ncbi:hypothetical protein SAMN05216266_10733 [Amycolatopsis marina]|uniref:Uncharacterized protein n=1 Tax=Amycolatopsis marina TaxID=490629 RepID=A0A1I0ZJ14_9PSEU|nr:hypothetical protein [Amycolatopsis marina]SFB25511.1 hypothetical protein SAMN05216266_10733 [Amycolatopsis marina]
MSENRTAPDISTEPVAVPPSGDPPGEPGRTSLAAEPRGDGKDDCIVLGYN